jgi:hypothetical protein
MTVRRSFTPTFKARVVLEDLTGVKSASNSHFGYMVPQTAPPFDTLGANGDNG